MAATTSVYFPLATEAPCTQDCGTTSGIDTTAGASGSSPGAGGLSQGAMTAIIVVVVVVGVLGIASAVLFYLAKKREWKVRESIRRSARKVVNALTPRRSEFPRSVKDGSSSRRGARARFNDDDDNDGNASSLSNKRSDSDLEKGHGAGGRSKPKPAPLKGALKNGSRK